MHDFMILTDSAHDLPKTLLQELAHYNQLKGLNEQQKREFS